jgi:hypothetical protein
MRRGAALIAERRAGASWVQMELVPALRWPADGVQDHNARG